ncbi:MAG: SGNH/GDSL hydrolase family protein [Bryobacteraceae bacterium]
MFRLIAGFCLFWLLCQLPAPAQTGFFLKDGDRVVFYGDSITDQRLYTTFTETYVLTRFPGMKVTFVHSGWGGDRVTGGGGGPIDQRLQRDVFPYKPTVMTIMLGMNDGSYRAFDQAIFDTYASGYRHIVQSVKGTLPGIRITAIVPSPYDDVTRAPNFDGGYNAVLIRYGNFVRELAGSENLGTADLNTSVVAALKKAKELNPEVAQKILPDRVHPGPGGHLLMAEALLKAWKAPALVSSVEIDAAQSRVVKADHTEVTGLTTGALSWAQTDEALPMPLDMQDAPLALALRSSDFVEALDQEPLRVTGLTAERYRLEIDGEPAGTFSREELATGINLATLPTPMVKQAARVHELTLRHNGVHFARWRQIQVPLAPEHADHLQAALDALDALEADLIQQQHAAGVPKEHRFALIAQ